MASTPSPTATRSIHPFRRTLRYWISRLAAGVVTHAWIRIQTEGFERLPKGPAIYCFNHLSWADPFVLMATLPMRPRLSFFGPKEEDMGVGGRNRLMSWTGTTIPYKPGKNDLLEATRKVGSVIAGGTIVAIAGEGRIGAVETAVLPLNDGPAYFALRSHVPLVPIAINGTSWLRFGGRVRVRVGEPIVGTGRPYRANVPEMTAAAQASLEALVADAREPVRSGRSGGWLTERFNEWPEGCREAALAAQLAQIAARTEAPPLAAAGG